MPIHEGLFSSEPVSEGHPHKLADRISDKVLDAPQTSTCSDLGRCIVRA